MQISNIYPQNQLIENTTQENAIQLENKKTIYHEQETHKQISENTDIKSIENTLKSLGYKTNEENIKMVNILIENDLPITKNNLQRLNQSLKLMGETSIKESVFLIKNEIIPTTTNTDILKGYINGTTNIFESLNNILSALSSDTQNEELLTILNKFTESNFSNSEIEIFNNANCELKQLFSNEKILEILDKYINSSDFHKEFPNFQNSKNTIKSDFSTSSFPIKETEQSNPSDNTISTINKEYFVAKIPFIQPNKTPVPSTITPQIKQNSNIQNMPNQNIFNTAIQNHFEQNSNIQNFQPQNNPTLNIPASLTQIDSNLISNTQNNPTPNIPTSNIPASLTQVDSNLIPNTQNNPTPNIPTSNIPASITQIDSNLISNTQNNSTPNIPTSNIPASITQIDSNLISNTQNNSTPNIPTSDKLNNSTLISNTQSNSTLIPDTQSSHAQNIHASTTQNSTTQIRDAKNQYNDFNSNFPEQNSNTQNMPVQDSFTQNMPNSVTPNNAPQISNTQNQLSQNIPTTPIAQLLNRHEKIFIPILERSINLGSLNLFRNTLLNYGFKEKFSIPELSTALIPIFEKNPKLKITFNSLPEVKIALSFSSKITGEQSSKQALNIASKLYPENIKSDNSDIEQSTPQNSTLNYVDTEFAETHSQAKLKNNHTLTNTATTISKNQNTFYKQTGLNLEKVFFQNKKLLLPAVEKSIKENSLTSFKETLSNIGYKEDLSLVELNNTLKIALWDNKKLMKKFTEIPEVKTALKDSESDRLKTNSKEETEMFINNIQNKKNLFSLNDFNIKDLRKIFESAFKNHPKLNERAHELLNTKEEFLNKALKKFSIDFSKDYSELDNFSGNFTEKISSLKSEFTASQNPVSNETSFEIKNILNNLEFASQFKDMAYFQYPIIINNNPTTAELYIFENKAKHKNSKSASAVISLDLAFLGHFEAYINKEQNNIFCQFKTENKNIEKLISVKINDLNNALKNYNYNLKQVTFKEFDEKFTVLSKEPSLIKKEQKKTSFALDITT